MLILTGTRDKSMQTGDYKSRTLPYESLPAGCKWIGVIDDATHMSFAGAGSAETTEKLTMLETKAFLAAFAQKNAALPCRQAELP